MKPDTSKDRNKVLSAIKRKPGVTIFELVRIVNLPRSFIAITIAQLQRKEAIRAVKLPARPGISEIRRGYEIVTDQRPSPHMKHVIPAQWDAMVYLFGTAMVMP
jgi:predicted transcriptional regulator